MPSVLPILVSVLGGACTLAFVTRLLADVVQPNSDKNTWKNALLTVAGMLVVAGILGVALHFSPLKGLPGAAQTVLAAAVVVGSLGGIVTRLFDMHVDDVLAAVPVIGTTASAMGALLFFAFAS